MSADVAAALMKTELFKSEGKGAGTERGGLPRPCSDTFRPPRESRSQQQQQRRHQHQQQEQQQEQQQQQGVVMARKLAASAPPAVPAPLSPRPATRSSARFGNLSQHSFFSRHNPHPQRVRHIRGLNDVPICSVNDEGFMSSPRYSLSLSPLRALLLRCGLSASSPGSPAGLGPLPFALPFPATPSSLQQQQQHGGGGGGERGSVPRVGPVSLTDAWRDELRELTERAGFLARREKKPQQPEGPALRPGTRYSLATGRIVPPPSRAASRTPGRLSSRNGARDLAAHGDPDHELLVLELLCQILQTDSISAVKEWLLAAGPREKDLVLAMIRIALEDEAAPQPPAPHADPRPDSHGSLRKTPRSRMGNRSRSVEAHVPESIPEEEEPERVGDAEVLTIQRSSSADDITRSAASRPRAPRASAGPPGAARAAESDVAPASASAKPRSGRKTEQQQQQHQLPAAPVDAKLRYTKTPHTPGESAQRPAQPKHSAAQM